MDKKPIENKTDLLTLLSKSGEVGSHVFEVQKSAILVRCSEDIEKSIDSLNKTISLNSTSNEKLSNRLFWLNIILGIITLVGAVFGILGFYFQLKP